MIKPIAKRTSIKEELITNVEPEQIKEEQVDMSDLDSRYLKLRIGESLTFENKKIMKVTDPTSEFNLSKVVYHYEVYTMGDKIISVSAWGLWNEIRQRLRESGKTEGVILKVDHPKNGIYSAEVVVK